MKSPLAMNVSSTGFLSVLGGAVLATARRAAAAACGALRIIILTDQRARGDGGRGTKLAQRREGYTEKDTTRPLRFSLPPAFHHVLDAVLPGVVRILARTIQLFVNSLLRSHCAPHVTPYSATGCSNNLLYPKEDKATMTLKYACRRCDYEEEADDHVVYKNELKATAK